MNESNIKTPGVYVSEIPSFPPSIAQVATAIPAFIGYTETDTDAKGNSWHRKPKRITSFLEYQQTFGGPQKEKHIQVAIVEHHNSSDALISTDVTASLNGAQSIIYLMYYSIQIYFMNGGGPCYIVSSDTYQTGATPSVDPASLTAGLATIEAEDEPTLIVFPDGQSVDNSAGAYFTLQQSSLDLCAKLQDRFALIDVSDNSNDTNTNASNFRAGNLANNLNYGATYYPNLITTIQYIYTETDVPLTFTSADSGAVVLSSANLSVLATDNKIVYSQVVNAIKLLGVQLPPSPAMAGVMATVDATRGVWKAPANVGLVGVFKLTDNITDESQAGLNIDASGKSINAIRYFTNKGILVWGARTLDGNSNDFRYISVRRFYIMVEESVKDASMQFVFEPNDGTTWVRIQAMIENYLTNLWRSGALAGSKPEQAFYVSVGLGKTMTFDDILNGKLIVEIGMAPVRPAEFIILRFSQIQQQA